MAPPLGTNKILTLSVVSTFKKAKLPDREFCDLKSQNVILTGAEDAGRVSFHMTPL